MFSLRSAKLLRPAVARPIARRGFANSPCTRRAFAEGDYVLLRSKNDSSQDGTLVRLKKDKVLHGHRGALAHNDIISKQPRQVVQTHKGTSIRLHEPTLAEYVRLTPRLVTPIYPSDTNLIVSLLDIHVDHPPHIPTTDPPLEILEAGTGHGALTLHLSRAIHAANPRPPPDPTHATEQDSEDAVYLGETIAEPSLDVWKKNRRAIVHTLDISSKYSAHAQKIVRGFRHGMYAGNVDFHVGDVSAWIAEQKELRSTNEAFLSHVFLDLPNATNHLANVAPVLHVNGLLAVFNPSITQIAECVDLIREQKLPYVLDQVVELGASFVREWDVRAVKPRAGSKKVEVQPDTPAGEGATDAPGAQEARDGELAQDLGKQEDKWVMVCRPRAGQQIVGGGFLGLWRRMEGPESPKTDGGSNSG